MTAAPAQARPIRALDDPPRQDGSRVPPSAPLLAARYGRNSPAELAAPTCWNATLAGLLQHRSVRAYLPDRLPPDVLDTIIAAAQSASTSSNLQAWSVVVIQDDARKERLSYLAGDQKHIRDAPLLLVWLADLARSRTLATTAARPDEGLHFLETFVVAAIDVALAAQNAVIALESLGLGAVYIGALRNHPKQVAAELGLPPCTVALFGMCVGFADPNAPAEVKPRLPQPAVVHRETYSTAAPSQTYDDYDALLRDFQRSQHLAPIGWIEAVLNRLGSVAALNGRDKLRQQLHELGFQLR